MNFFAIVFGKLITKLPWLASPWVKIAFYAIVTGMIFAAGWHTKAVLVDASLTKQYEKQLADQKADYDAQHEADIKQHATDETTIKNSALAADTLKQTVRDLQEALQHKPLTEKRPENPDVPNSPIIVARGSTFRVCYNAAQKGDATSIAACKASGVPVRM